jgi:hypothetical protein
MLKSFLRMVGFGQTNSKQKAPPTRARPATRPRVGNPGTGDRFHFHEGLVATKGGGSQIGKYSPQAGCAIVEIHDQAGRILALDVFKTSEPAPRGPWKPLPGVCATKVVPGDTGRPHQEFEFGLAGPHPLELPQHLLDKMSIGGTLAKVWISCEK